MSNFLIDCGIHRRHVNHNELTEIKSEQTGQLLFPEKINSYLVCLEISEGLYLDTPNHSLKNGDLLLS